MVENEFNLTFFEACEFLSRGRKSVSRYIRQGLLHPKEIKSALGTREYRFSKDDLLKFKAVSSQDQTGSDGTGQDEPGDSPALETQKGEPRRDKTSPEETGHDPAMVSFLMEQIKIKDKQIESQGDQITQLIERDRESNVIIQSLHQKLEIGPGKEELTDNTK